MSWISTVIVKSTLVVPHRHSDCVAYSSYAGEVPFVHVLLFRKFSAPVKPTQDYYQNVERKPCNDIIDKKLYKC